MSGAAFRYVALDAAGRKVRGTVEAETENAAHASLYRQGLTALRLGPASAGEPRFPWGGGGLSRRRLGDFLHDLGALAQAGVGLRAALSVLASPAERHTAVGRTARILEKEIASGKGLGAAFSKALGRRAEGVAGIVAAAESSGDLGGALSRAADNIEEEIEAADGIISALSYPAFVLLMTIVSVVVILLVVVPALAPLMEESKQALPLPMAVMFSVSDFLVGHRFSLSVSSALAAAALFAGWQLGLVQRPLELWLIDGPGAALARGVVFGGVLSVFGSLLIAKVPASEALQLAARTTRLRAARDRLESCVARIREGAPISQALATCKGMPRSAIRLASIGEEAGLLGSMLQRSGKLERQRALRRIRSMSAWLGPALIIVLGGLIGLILGSLLSSVSAIGDAATTS